MKKERKNKVDENGNSKFENKLGDHEIISFTRREILEARGWDKKKRTK